MFCVYYVNINMKKNISFSDRTIKAVEFIKDKEGHKTFTAALHAIVAGYYKDNYFVKYKQQSFAIDPLAQEEELTNEQKCEQKGGKIENSGGGVKMCVMRIVKKSPAVGGRVVESSLYRSWPIEKEGFDEWLKEF